jgi:hypothetical protein
MTLSGACSRFWCRVVLLTAVAVIATAASRSQATPSGIPTGVLNAKSIFVSNGGSDAGLFPEPFSGDTNPAYFGLVKGLQGAALPFFRLTIYDRKTHYVLWTITEPIEFAILQKTHDKNFDEALSHVVDDLQALSKPGAGAMYPHPPARPSPWTQ